MGILMGSIVARDILAVSLLIVIGLLVLQSWRLQRRERDLAAARDVLLDRDQLATLGGMMAGIAHELSTPLGAVRCSLGTRQKAVAKLEEAVGGLARPEAEQGELLVQAGRALQALHGTDPILNEAMARTDLLIRELRAAGRGRQDAPQPVDVNNLVRGTLLLAHHELKNVVTVKLELGEIEPVWGWPGGLGQVFLNLVINARQAVGEQGTLTISTAMADGKVVVQVADDGPGLPVGAGNDIFRQGFTTKDAASGSGLGLHISQRIVERHRGTIRAANGTGGGAEFTVTLPTERVTGDRAAD